MSCDVIFYVLYRETYRRGGHIGASGFDRFARVAFGGTVNRLAGLGAVHHTSNLSLFELSWAIAYRHE